MPHVTLKHSSNLDGKVDFTVHRTILDTGLFELGAVRVRVLRSEAYAVADLLHENGFIDMQLRIGAGRRKAAGEAIMGRSRPISPTCRNDALRAALELREIDPVLSWKKNAIHPRLRGKH